MHRTQISLLIENPPTVPWAVAPGATEAGLRPVDRMKSGPVAVGTAIADRPPHRPVLALLTHTVPTSDIGIFGVKTQIGIGMQNLDRWKQTAKPLVKTCPG